MWVGCVYIHAAAYGSSIVRECHVGLSKARSYTKKQIIEGGLLHHVSSGLALGGLLDLSRLAAGMWVRQGVAGGGRRHLNGVLLTELPNIE